MWRRFWIRRMKEYYVLREMGKEVMLNEVQLLLRPRSNPRACMYGG
jgi:hypothetical protein